MKDVSRWMLVAAGVMGFTAIVAGTFAAHYLPWESLDPDAPRWWDTGAKYHLAHAPVLLGLAVLAAFRPDKLTAASAVCFCVGVVIFAGSLYVMSLTGLRWLGAITPIGGLNLMAGWVLLFVAGLRGEVAGEPGGAKTTPGQ
ncbi:MAG: DUF423 domain-containing protein [Planctomycetota bacterium]